LWRCGRNAVPKIPYSDLNDAAIDAMNGFHTDGGFLPKGGGMQAVVDLLRSDEPINAEVRALLAELLDRKGKSTWQLVMQKREAGRPHNRETRLNIGRQIAARMADAGYESAIAEVAEKHKIKRTQAAKCLSFFRRVQKQLASDAESGTEQG
jgi:hypothetical protein